MRDHGLALGHVSRVVKAQGAKALNFMRCRAQGRHVPHLSEARQHFFKILNINNDLRIQTNQINSIAINMINC